MSRNWTETAIFALRRNRWIFFGGDKTDVVEFQFLQLDGFLNQVAIPVAQMLKFWRWHAHVKRTSRNMTVTGGFEPSLELWIG